VYLANIVFKKYVSSFSRTTFSTRILSILFMYTF